MLSENLVEVENLKHYFPIRGGIFAKTVSFIHAVDYVSLSIKRGETFGLVGESGCGKTTFGRCVLMLLRPEGSILFDGEDLNQLKKEELRKLRVKMSMIFQDPFPL